MLLWFYWTYHLKSSSISSTHSHQNRTLVGGSRHLQNKDTFETKTKIGWFYQPPQRWLYLARQVTINQASHLSTFSPFLIIIGHSPPPPPPPRCLFPPPPSPCEQRISAAHSVNNFRGNCAEVWLAYHPIMRDCANDRSSPVHSEWCRFIDSAWWLFLLWCCAVNRF